jgi:hypothetical protein
MANLALEFNAVVPVREDDRRHAPLLGFAVEHHIAIISSDSGPGGKQQPKPDN